MDKIWIVWYLDNNNTEVVVIPFDNEIVASTCYNDVKRSHRYSGMNKSEVRHSWMN